MKYGLWDTKERCWLGNGAESEGPNLYDDEMVARAAATIASIMLKVPLGTIRALQFEGEHLFYKDQIEAELSCEEVIDSMEQVGVVLVCVQQKDTWTWPEYLGEKTAGVCSKCEAPIFFEKQNEPLRKICAQCAWTDTVLGGEKEQP